MVPASAGMASFSAGGRMHACIHMWIQGGPPVGCMQGLYAYAFYLCGGLKAVYDLLLLASFRAVPPVH